jgi:hypothetical protein
MINWDDYVPLADHVGFVYTIHNRTTDRFYIGKKMFWTTVVKPPLAGMKRKRKTVKPSDWQQYWGSNSELLADIAAGHDCTRWIRHICLSKAEMTYRESKAIFDVDALISPRFYNSWVVCKVSSNQLAGLTRDFAART